MIRPRLRKLNKRRGASAEIEMPGRQHEELFRILRFLCIIEDKPFHAVEPPASDL